VILGEKQVGDKLALQILREGKKLNVTVELKEKVELVPRAQYDVTPSYYIFGGLVFQVLCRDYLATWDTWWEKAPKEFLHTYYSGGRTSTKQETVILSQILADQINVGYESYFSESIVSVNDKKPRDLRHLVTLIETSKKVVELRTSSNALIVMEVKETQKRSEEILARYRIERDRSEDLLSPVVVIEAPKPIKPRKHSGQASRGTPTRKPGKKKRTTKSRSG
jgi:hypothetical protein